MRGDFGGGRSDLCEHFHQLLRMDWFRNVDRVVLGQQNAQLVPQVAGHVDDIVGAAQDEVVAIFVANATVEGCMVEAARKMVKDFPRPPLEGIAVPGGAAEVAGSYS
jgi:hypothetical protein